MGWQNVLLSLLNHWHHHHHHSRQHFVIFFQTKFSTTTDENLQLQMNIVKETAMLAAGETCFEYRVKDEHVVKKIEHEHSGVKTRKVIQE